MGKTVKANSFEDLEVWKRSHKFVLNIYQITNEFPSEERFGLTSQMRRSAVSIPANIAEGFKKRTLRDKSNFYNIAQGSLEEVHYYLILSRDLKYLPDNEKLLNDVKEIGKMLNGLIKSIQQ